VRNGVMELSVPAGGKIGFRVGDTAVVHIDELASTASVAALIEVAVAAVKKDLDARMDSMQATIDEVGTCCRPVTPTYPALATPPPVITEQASSDVSLCCCK